jgi:hypothetical protein
MLVGHFELIFLLLSFLLLRGSHGFALGFLRLEMFVNRTEVTILEGGDFNTISLEAI